jgi:hypothetical protein
MKTTTACQAGAAEPAARAAATTSILELLLICETMHVGKIDEQLHWHREPLGRKEMPRIPGRVNKQEKLIVLRQVVAVYLTSKSDGHGATVGRDMSTA